MDFTYEDTKKMLRSVLLSAKDGVALDKLETEYVDLVGFPIPVRELGFRDLSSLLRSIPDICTLQWSRGRMTVSGVADNSTNHIKEMVAKQNTNKGSGCGGGGGHRRWTGGGRDRYRRNTRTYDWSDPSDTEELYQNFDIGGGTIFGPRAVLTDVSKSSEVKDVSKYVTTNTVSEEVEERNTDWTHVEHRVRKILKNQELDWKVVEVETLYVNLHGESLPQTWIERLQTMGCLQVTSQQDSMVCRLVSKSLPVPHSSSSVSYNSEANISTMSHPRYTGNSVIVSRTAKTQPHPSTSTLHHSSILSGRHLPSISSTEYCHTLPSFPLPRLSKDVTAPAEEDYYDVHVCVVPAGGVTFHIESYMDQPKYESLHTAMAEHYSQFSNWRSVSEAELSYGSMVAVKCNERWQRARVLRPRGSPMFPLSLGLVDCGLLIQKTSIQGLQPLWRQFGDLPVGSIKARLAGVRPFYGEHWDKKATDWFRARILDRNLLALVQGVDEDRTLSLILVDTNGEEEEGVDIAREMFELGLARKVI